MIWNIDRQPRLKMMGPGNEFGIVAGTRVVFNISLTSVHFRFLVFWYPLYMGYLSTRILGDAI